MVKTVISVDPKKLPWEQETPVHNVRTETIVQLLVSHDLPVSHCRSSVPCANVSVGTLIFLQWQQSKKEKSFE